MPTEQEIVEIKQELANNAAKFKLSGNLIDVIEGQLIEYVLGCLRKQFTGEAFHTASQRLSPINMLKKIVDKLSPIYKPAPRRSIEGGTTTDSELLEFYESNMDINVKMLWAARNVVLNKGAFVMPFVHRGLPRLRILTKDHFYVRGTDGIDPMFPTELITFCNFNSNKMAMTYYSENEVAIYDADGNLNLEAMNADGIDGSNPLKALPGVYWNDSQCSIFPAPSEDMFAMTTLIPILLTDLNYAQMFQCFSIFYTINTGSDQKFKIAPNAVLQLQQDLTVEGAPSIGTLQPSVDTQGALSNIQSQISMWLNSHGIKPGSIGTLTQDSFASGISKMVDEMDTLELRQSLVQQATAVENALWSFIINTFHPWALARGLFAKGTPDFSKGAEVEVNFTEQMPLNGRGQLVKDLALEVAEKFTTNARAIKVLNPQMTDKEIEELQAEIKQDGVSTEMAPSSNQDTAGFDQSGTAADSNQNY